VIPPFPLCRRSSYASVSVAHCLLVTFLKMAAKRDWFAVKAKRMAGIQIIGQDDPVSGILERRSKASVWLHKEGMHSCVVYCPGRRLPEALGACARAVPPLNSRACCG
jgi:hypothetical protein